MNKSKSNAKKMRVNVKDVIEVAGWHNEYHFTGEKPEYKVIAVDSIKINNNEINISDKGSTIIVGWKANGIVTLGFYKNGKRIILETDNRVVKEGLVINDNPTVDDVISSVGEFLSVILASDDDELVNLWYKGIKDNI